VFPGENPSAERERRLQEVLREQGALPRLVITAVASTAAVLVFVNILVVLCVLRHRQNKKQRKPSGWLNFSKLTSLVVVSLRFGFICKEMRPGPESAL
jgi:uncharacterized membrane protein YbjE (DUF340 family)